MNCGEKGTLIAFKTMEKMFFFVKCVKLLMDDLLLTLSGCYAVEVNGLLTPSRVELLKSRNDSYSCSGAGQGDVSIRGRPASEPAVCTACWLTGVTLRSLYWCAHAVFGFIAISQWFNLNCDLVVTFCHDQDKFKITSLACLIFSASAILWRDGAVDFTSLLLWTFTQRVNESCFKNCELTPVMWTLAKTSSIWESHVFLIICNQNDFSK